MAQQHTWLYNVYTCTNFDQNSLQLQTKVWLGNKKRLSDLRFLVSSCCLALDEARYLKVRIIIMLMPFISMYSLVFISILVSHYAIHAWHSRSGINFIEMCVLTMVGFGWSQQLSTCSQSLLVWQVRLPVVTSSCRSFWTLFYCVFTLSWNCHWWQ